MGGGPSVNSFNSSGIRTHKHLQYAFTHTFLCRVNYNGMYQSRTMPRFARRQYACVVLPENRDRPHIEPTHRSHPHEPSHGTVRKQRSEERSVGKEWVRTCSSRRSPYHQKKNT